MWCIPKLDNEYIRKMIDVLEVYEKPYNPKQPVICFDEKSKQLLANKRKSLPISANKSKRYDYEYKRNGTVNLFIAIEPKGKKRSVKITKHRKKPDFAREIKQLVLKRYKNAEKVILVTDNLNIHTPKCIRDELPAKTAKKILDKVSWHYTPKHASWLNMAEIEISALSRQCLSKRIPTFQDMQKQVAAWTRYRNNKGIGINWQFTGEKAQEKFKFCRMRKLRG
jgi:transposase